MSLSDMLGSMILTLGPKSGAADAVTAWRDAAPATPGTRTPTSKTAAKARPKSDVARMYQQPGLAWLERPTPRSTTRPTVSLIPHRPRMLEGRRAEHSAGTDDLFLGPR